MSGQEAAGSRKWHTEQEILYIEHLSKSRFKPIGGDSDGRMERKDETVWQPLADSFNDANMALRERLKTRGGKEIKGYFDVPMLKRKFDSMRAKYLQLRTTHKVGRHQLVGETGAAAEGQAGTAQAAVDAATKQVHWFSAFHAAFGEVQRLRNDTWTESISPGKVQRTPGSVGSTKGLDSDPPRPTPEAGREKRPRAAAAVVCLEDITDSGDDLAPDEINADIEKDIDKNEDASDDGVPGAKKRSRRSARDVALGKALSDNRMEVAVKSAALRESSMLKVAKLQNSAKTVLADRQMQVQREGIAAMKTCQLAKIQGTT
jgi:hypothetical protein